MVAWCCFLDVDKPSIVSQNGTFNTTENSTLAIQCIASTSLPASSDLQYFWYHKGKMLIGESPVLTLKNLKRSQGGQYACVTRNKYGEEKSEKTVYVECKNTKSFFRNLEILIFLSYWSSFFGSQLSS